MTAVRLAHGSRGLVLSRTRLVFHRKSRHAYGPRTQGAPERLPVCQPQGSFREIARGDEAPWLEVGRSNRRRQRRRESSEYEAVRRRCRCPSCRCRYISGRRCPSCRCLLAGAGSSRMISSTTCGGCCELWLNRLLYASASITPPATPAAVSGRRRGNRRQSARCGCLLRLLICWGAFVAAQVARQNDGRAGSRQPPPDDAGAFWVGCGSLEPPPKMLASQENRHCSVQCCAAWDLACCSWSCNLWICWACRLCVLRIEAL